MGLRAIRVAFRASTLPAAFLCSLAAGCGGGGGGSDPEYGANDLYVVDMDLDQLDGVSLNTPMIIEFSEFVLPHRVLPLIARLNRKRRWLTCCSIVPHSTRR